MVKAHLAFTGDVIAEDVAAHSQPACIQRNLAALGLVSIAQQRIAGWARIWLIALAQ